MNKARHYYFGVLLCAIVYLLPFQKVIAEESDFGFNASYDDYLSAFTFEWIVPSEQQKVQFEVYWHKGTVYLNDNFQLFKRFDPDTLKSVSLGENTKFQFSYTDYSIYPRSFFAKAIYSDGSVKTSKLIYVSTGKGSKYWDPFTYKSEPPIIGKVGQKYEYDVDAESANKLQVHYKFIAAPQGAVIDELTGKITWTPDSSYRYYFTVSGWTEDQDRNYVGNEQSWLVFVPTCQTSTRIFGHVTDKDGNTYSKGYAEISSVIFGAKFVKKCDLVNGDYQFNDLEKGDYEVKVFTRLDSGSAKEERHTHISLACGEAKQIDFQFTPPDTNNRISFSTVPPNRIVLGNEYVYQAKASAKNANLKIKYSIITEPAGATIDENTGEFRWTPVSLGHYSFNIAATAVENEFYDSLNAIQYIHFEVGNCENPGKLKVTVNVHPDVDFILGEVHLFTNNPADMVNLGSPKYRANRSQDGVCEFNSLDSGTYYLKAQSVIYVINGSDHYANDYWYEADVTGENATPIRIDCGDAKELTLNILPLAPYYYRFSGRVTADDGKPIRDASIRLYIQDDGYAGTKTDSNGYYDFYAPTKSDFIASAWIENKKISSHFAYDRLYYPQSPSPDKAKIFESNSVYENIDFVFPTHEEYNNSAAGKITYEGSAYKNSTEVALYYVDPIDKYLDWKDRPFYADIDSEGVYKIENLIPGKYIAFATPRQYSHKDNLPAYYREDGSAADNWLDASRIVVAENSQITGINIELPKRKGVLGDIVLKGYIYETKKKQIVKGMDELPEDTLRLPGANIYPVNALGERHSFAVTNIGGWFTLDRISSDIKALKIDKVGYDIQNIDIKDAGQPGNIQLKLEPKGLYEKPELAFCQISPNPAAETLRLDFTADGATRISLVNSFGIKVYSAELGSMSGNSTHSIDLVSLPQGAYYVFVESGARASVLPVVIIK